MTGEQRIERALRELGQTPEGKAYAESVLAHVGEDPRAHHQPERSAPTMTTPTTDRELLDQLHELLATLRLLVDQLDERFGDDSEGSVQ